MADSSGITGDNAGISDILAAADKRNICTEESSQLQNGLEADHTEPKENSASSRNAEDELNHDDDSIEEKNKNHSRDEESDEKVKKQTQNPQENYSGDINLADPESVIHMLETVDLTEEDTEILLQEAYNMNRKLKEMLRRQKDASKPNPKLKSKAHPNFDSQVSSGTSSSGNSRKGSSIGIKTVLPPINTGDREASVYAIKLRRSKTNVPETKPATSDSMILRSKSTKAGSRKDSESPTRRRRASGPRPEWNDRFNYT